MIERLSRRRAIAALGAGAGGLLLSGCDRIAATPTARTLFTGAEGLTLDAQRLITDRRALAPEFARSDLSPVFRSNGTAVPVTPDYSAHLAKGFSDYRLPITGLVSRPIALTLAEIRSLPVRHQITRHDCVEGWSAIGHWTGTPLGPILHYAGLKPEARYIVFHCFDEINGVPYYESVDLIDAFHPQTILAYGLNGHGLPVPNGAPLRVRIERQLGYKHAKFLKGIEAVASLTPVGRGKGGFWEDVSNYAWYAGI